VPRLRPDRPKAAFGLGASVAALALVAGALAQTAPATLPENGTFDPPSSHGVLDPDSNNEPPQLIRKNVPTFGNPPASGAGKTGFDSTNARRKIQTAVENKKERRPLPRVVTTQITPVQSLPPAPVLAPLRPADPVTTGSIGPPYAPPYARPAKSKSKPTEIDPYEPLGIRSGSFILRPAIDLATGHDSNPARDSTPRGSPFYVIAPELQAKSDWDRHEVRASLRGSYNGYTEDSSLNRPNFDAVVDGRIDVTRETRAELQGRFRYSADVPGSPNFQADVAELTPFTNIGGTAGLVHRFNRAEIGGKVSIDRTSYEDSKLTDGTTASNENRNLTTYGLELRGSYEWLPGIKPFVAVATDKRAYDDSIACFCLDRDSQGLTPRIGTSLELSRLLTGEVSIGYTTRRYEDPQLQTLSGVIADASLIWSATALTKATFTARSSVYESIETDVSGVLARDFGVQIDHSFRDWLIGTLKFGYGLDDYIGTSRVDNRFSVGAGLTYKMNRNVQLKGEVRREQRSSNVPNEDYTANIFLLGLRLQR
jgi:hypothetical protein